MHFGQMKRREFITLAGAAAWPLTSWAQSGQGPISRVGVLMSNNEGDPEASSRVAAFEGGLQKVRLAKGRNVLVHYRFGVNNAEQDRNAVSEIVGLRPDVILAHTPSTLAALQRATRTIPIVFVQAADPVEVGLVTNLTTPEGNITGFVAIEPSLAGKWLQWLHDVARDVTRVLVLQGSDNPSSPGFMRVIEGAAPSFNIELSAASIRDPGEIEQAIARFANDSNGGLLMLPSPILTAGRQRIISLASLHRLPAIYPFKYLVNDGGLMFYGADNVDQWRQAASYVDRILRGAKPHDLPVQLPSKFELVLNLKTAKALGLTIPRDMLLIADELIE